MGEVGKGMVGFCDDIILALWKAVKFAGKLYALALREGEIQEVILKTKQTETSIWTADPGEAAAERCGVFRYPGRK